VDVRVLGAFEVVRGGVVLTPSAPKLRRVFALLAIHANRVVRIDQLIEELWEDRPPFSANTTLQTYVYQLRKLLGWSARADGSARQADGQEVTLRTTPGGYLLSLPAGALDAKRFEQLAEEGRAKLDAGDLDGASKTLRQALQLWCGPAFTAVSTGPLLQAEVVRMEELRKIVLGHRIEADLQLGRHAELIGELTTLVTQQPTHEGFQAKLMLSLYRSGRRSEALQAYQRARSVLARELGLEPSAELQRLHQAVLAADPSLDAPSGGLASVRAAAEPEPPNQLPLDLPRIVGRCDGLDAVRHALAETDRVVPPVALVAGAPGAGKSAFAVHAAHLVRAEYPNGTLYAKLLRPDGTLVSPAAVLTDFLAALGLRRERGSAPVDELARIFRSWTARRKVLVVLDDVIESSQLQPLLPSGPGCATIVASRRLLSHPAIVLTTNLSPLDTEQSRQMLVDVLGADRIVSESEHLHELIDLCGGLPVALRSAANLLQLRPHWRIGRLLARMRGQGRRMSVLSTDELNIADSVERSLRLLPPEVQDAFRVVARKAERLVSLREAAGMLGVEEAEAEMMMEHLVEFQIAEAHGQGEEAFDYRIRAPFRAVAEGLSPSTANPPDGRCATLYGAGVLDTPVFSQPPALA
jgi:DNA-binding SARP family transcriptional activator